MTKKDYQKFANLFVNAYKEYATMDLQNQRNWPNWFENQITDLFYKENDRFDMSKWSKWIDKRLSK